MCSDSQKPLLGAGYPLCTNGTMSEGAWWWLGHLTTVTCHTGWWWYGSLFKKYQEFQGGDNRTLNPERVPPRTGSERLYSRLAVEPAGLHMAFSVGVVCGARNWWSGKQEVISS